MEYFNNIVEIFAGLAIISMSVAIPVLLWMLWKLIFEK